MAPVGLWGMKGSSLLAFGEKRRKTEVSTPILFISVVEAAFASSLVCGTTDIEETFNLTWSLTEFLHSQQILFC